MDNIKAKVKEFIIENFLFGDEDAEISNNESLMESGYIDSTSVLELIAFLEESYEVKIENDEILPVNLDTLDNIEAFVIKKKEVVAA